MVYKHTIRIMRGYVLIGFIGFMLKGKRFLDYANLFSPNDYEKNDKKILKSFQYIKRWKNYIALIAVSIENLKNLKYHIFSKKDHFFLLFLVNIKMKMKKIFKEDESIEILKILRLLENI